MPRPARDHVPHADPAAELAQRITDGDPAAEAELVERFRPGLLVVLRHHARHEHEDLCQEVLRIAIEQLRRGTLRAPERLAAYLWGIARNVARKQRRTSWREVALEQVLPRATSEADPERAAAREERHRLMRAALTCLCERDRELLHAFYLAEQDKAVVCARLGVTPDQFDVVKFRALRRFRRLLQERDTDRPGPPPAREGRAGRTDGTPGRRR